MNKWKAVSFFTTDFYIDYGMKLIESLESVGIKDHYVVPIEPLKCWKDVGRVKGNFILDCLNKFDCDIVWLDADAVVNKYPVIFDTIDCDFGIHFLDWIHYCGKLFANRYEKEALAATMYFRNNAKVRALLVDWLEHIDDFMDQLAPDQYALQEALERHPDLKVVDLPPGYCLIFDTMKGLDVPVIEQFQASRKARAIEMNRELEATNAVA
jgi:hypothetical protein